MPAGNVVFVLCCVVEQECFFFVFFCSVLFCVCCVFATIRSAHILNMFSTFVGFFAHLFFSFCILICKKILCWLQCYDMNCAKLKGKTAGRLSAAPQVEVGDSAAAV